MLHRPPAVAPPPTTLSLPSSLPPSEPLSTSHPLYVKAHSLSATVNLPSCYHPSPPPLSHFIYLFCAKTKKLKQKKIMFFVPCWLESFFFIQRVDWDFYFPISECWKYCIGEKNNNIIITCIVLWLYIMYSNFLSGTWNKTAEYAFFFFSFFFVIVISDVNCMEEVLVQVDSSCF